MGVRGLSRFIEECNFGRCFELHDTSVIIDGCSLLHCLYASSGAAYIYGGDYDVYAACIINYFSCLKECNIEPIVIFDGGYDKSDRMLQKLLERQKHKLKNIKKFLENKESSTEVLPINAFEVFKNTLSEMGILYAQCDYEGDNQMASLAVHYGCPILSEDSDFYIYDLPNGFIRLNHINVGVKTKTLTNGSKVKYISCKIYYLKSLHAVFCLKDRNVLPLLATLAGNDYASPYEEFKQFYWHHMATVPFRNKFEGLFSWLRSKTLDKAKSKVLNLIELEKRENVKSIIENSIEDYQIKPTNMVNILEYLSSNVHEALIEETKLVTPCGEMLPRDFVVAFHKGCLPPILMNIITLHRNILLPQIDDFSKSSSYTCSRYIRQVIYGILVHHYSRNSTRHVHECIRQIEEYDRNGKIIQRIPVEYLFELKNGNFVLKLSDIHTLNKDQLRSFMSNVLEVSGDFVSDVPSHLQLFFICVNYWLLKSSPKPEKESLLALILSLIYFQAKEILFETSRDAVFPSASISQQGANLVHSNLKKYCEKSSNSDEFFSSSIVHSFNQLQACISDCIALNYLLNAPFEPLKLHKLFNGTLLYNLTKELTEQRPNSSIRQLLGIEASKLFDMLLSKFLYYDV
ncbi:single-strand DNA endonuclease ASTE1 [Parasteatoda tepidariorum]|uniref:single-strand DNA endonuclease ASTE1 n=1 Tax=Parasteatoda tepidariorum TaxID=114398 RepID=UPI001C71B2EB|nr:protein asteroid homolog 1 [Parasteatoda tepidariorum]